MGRRAVNQPSKQVQGAAAASTGVTLPAGAVFPSMVEKHERLQIYITRFKLQTLTLSLDTGAGGANDGIGQKVGTMPEGHILVLGMVSNIVLTPQTGLSGASVVAAVGTTAGADNSETLTTTEADIIASHTFGDGTIASATAETDNTWHPAAINTVHGVKYVDGSTTAAPINYNVAGVWTEADDDPATATLAGYFDLLWSWLGDD